ncbi:hypothetical protein Tco_1120189 [Tanacetum coccineum]
MVENQLTNLTEVESSNLTKVESEDKLESYPEDNLTKLDIADSMKTPIATLYEHSETPNGSIFCEPHIQRIPIPVEGTYFDTLDEVIDMYTT